MPQDHAVIGTVPPDATPGTVAMVPAQRIHHLLSKKQLAGYLGVTGRTVGEYQRRGLPYFRLSARRNRYDLMAVRAGLERQCLVVRVR